MKSRIVAATSVALLLALSACGGGGMYADVARFHTNQPINRGSIAIVSADASNAGSLEFRTHAETVAVEMRRLGFTTGLPADQVQYLATLDITQSDGQMVTRPGTQVAVPTGPVQVQVPVGRNRTVTQNRTTLLSVQIMRRADSQMIWEGRASKEAPANSREATLTWAVPALAGALFQDFPGTPGQTVRVRL